MVADIVAKGGLEGIIERFVGGPRDNNSKSSRLMSYLPSKKEIVSELTAELAVEYLIAFGGAYLSGLSKRLEEAGNFYNTECRGDIKAHQLDELTSIIVYGDSNAYKTQDSGIQKIIHKYLSGTLKVARVDKLDNWKLTKGLFQKFLGYAPLAINKGVGVAQDRAKDTVSRTVAKRRRR